MLKEFFENALSILKKEKMGSQALFFIPNNLGLCNGFIQRHTAFTGSHVLGQHLRFGAGEPGSGVEKIGGVGQRADVIFGQQKTL